MKRIHLLKTELEPADLAPLIDELKGLGLRAGWLRWDPGSARSLGLEPGPLAGFAGLGVLRAVAVERDRVAVLKPMAGPAVFRDVLREHFRGCAVVLVRLEGPCPEALATAPILARQGEQYAVEPVAGSGHRELCCSAVELAGRLRRPRPFEH